MPNVQAIRIAQQPAACLGGFRCACRLSRVLDSCGPISGRSAELMRPSPLLIDNQVKPINEEFDNGRRRCTFPFGVFEAFGQVLEPGNRLPWQAFDRPDPA